MWKTIVGVLTLVLVLSLSGCVGSGGVESVAKGLPQVQAFLAQYPNAEFKMALWEQDVVDQYLDKIKEECGVQMKAVPYWVADFYQDSTHITVYIRESDNQVMCVIANGSKLIESGNPEEIVTAETTITDTETKSIDNTQTYTDETKTENNSEVTDSGVSLPFSDNFESADYSAKYWASWGFGENSFEVVNGGLQYLIDGKVPDTKIVGERFIGLKVNAKDYVVEVDLKNSQHAGIIVRGLEFAPEKSLGGLAYIYLPSNYSYEAKMPGKAYWTNRSYSWGSLYLESEKGTLDEGVNLHLKVVVQGNKFTAYVNGEESVTYIDEKNEYSGDKENWVGLYWPNTGQVFDNFKVTAIEDYVDSGVTDLGPAGVMTGFKDDFENPEFTKKYWADWGLSKNGFGVAAGKLQYLVDGVVPTTPYVGKKFVGLKVNAKNYIIEVDLKNSLDAGVVLRGTEYPYYAAIDGLTFIYKPFIESYGIAYPGESYWIKAAAGISGGWSDILQKNPTGTLAKGADVTLKFVVKGNTYTAYVNGEEWSTYVDNSGAEKDEKARWIGLYLSSSAQAFDNFKVTEIE